jgi:aryl-alcohol dehydrogenase-like predicted oxidoreductase
MISLPASTHIWIAASVTDLRRGFSGLSAVAQTVSLRRSERELIPMAKALNIGVTAWSPLAGGVLTGKYHGAKPASYAAPVIAPPTYVPFHRQIR